MTEVEVPEGWVRVSIPEVFEINPRKPAPDAVPPGTAVSFVPMAAVDADLGSIVSAQVRPFADVRNGYTAFRDGDVIMAKITPCFENGKAAIARGLVAGLGFGSSEFHVFRPVGAVEPEYLFHFVRQQSFRDEGADRMSGTAGQARVQTDYIREIEIPVPPLAEQLRIVEKVETLLAELNAARAHLALAASILSRFRQSALAVGCSGGLTEDWRVLKMERERPDDTIIAVGAGIPAEENLPEISIPAEWTWATTESLCERDRAITYGVVKLGPSVEGGVPTLRSSDVRPRFIDRTAVKCIGRNIADQYVRTYLRGGEVLVTVRGTLGGVAVVPADMAGYNISREVAQLPVKLAVNAKFVMYAIASKTSQNWLTERAKGVAYTGINIEDLRRLPLPLPSFDEQQEIVRRIDSIFAVADAVDNLVAAASARANKLTQSILTKAFRGELVPTEADLARQEGRDYEPASALLERIRTIPSEKSASGPRRRARARVAA